MQNTEGGKTSFQLKDVLSIVTKVFWKQNRKSRRDEIDIARFDDVKRKYLL